MSFIDKLLNLYELKFKTTAIWFNFFFSILFISLFLFLRIKSSTIGPLCIIFLDYAFCHLFLIYFELKLLSDKLFWSISIIFNTLESLFTLLFFFAILFFEKDIRDFYMSKQIVGEMDVLNGILNHKIIFAIFLFLLFMCFSLKTFLLNLLKKKKNNNQIKNEEYFFEREEQVFSQELKMNGREMT